MTPLDEENSTPPAVLSNSPVHFETGVPLNGNVSVTFSEAMDPSTLTTSTLILKPAIAGTVTYAGVTATFTPSSAFAADTSYSATVTTGAQNLKGEAIADNHEWGFRTGSTFDTTAPTVLSTNPAGGALVVSVNRSMTANFSEAMNPTTLTTATFTVTGPDATSVSGAVTYSGTQATFRPLANLAPDTLFHAVITTRTRDLAGNGLASNFVWSFTTSAGTASGPAPVLLGQAGDFVILAKSGVDTVPTSVVTGNIGVSPIDSTAVTGFSLTADASNQFATSGQITGQVRAANYSGSSPLRMITPREPGVPGVVG